MIEIRDVSKAYGRTLAVDHLTVTVKPGAVTGFLGPNGAGKSTTMRMVLGLARPTGGEILVGGRCYDRHAAPLHEVGALFDARAFHPGRTAREHLLSLALTGGYGRRRVREVLGTVGLDSVADRRTKGFSMGMGQRLGIAAALIGDPAVVMLDEPVNGLDPDGIRWIRGLLRTLADEGRTVFVSSHLMSEMAMTADQLIVIGRGRLIADVPMATLTAATTQVRVRTTEPDRLRDLVPASDGPDGTLLVTDVDAAAIARTALAHDLLILELTPLHPSLEDAYYALTRGEVEYTAMSGRAAA